MNKVRIFIGSLLLIMYSLHACDVVDNGNALKVTTMYGSMMITEPVLVDLIKSPTMERLKKIRQYGATCHATREPEYTRYQHSLGVLHILRMFGAPLEEQIDGLLHDASHTVFSHVGDYLFNHLNKTTSYQDEIHEWFLEKMGASDILHTYHCDDSCSHAAKKRHRCLEQDKPDLCADRIEYNLSGGLIDNMLTIDDVQNILKSLHFEHQQWFFDDVAPATLFARTSIQLSVERWGAPWNVFVDHCACQALSRAVALQALDTNAIHFSTDDEVWGTLCALNDSQVHMWLNRLQKQSFYETSADDYDMHLVGKFSGTDPLVKTATGLQRLSALDRSFEQYYRTSKEAIAKGVYIKFSV